MNTRFKIAASGLVIAALAATAIPAFASASSGKGMGQSVQAHAKGRMHLGPLTALVTAGTITRAQADAVETTTRTAMETAEVANFNAGLAALVANNTITQAQADAAKASVTTVRGDHDHLNLSTWTTAQRTALHTWLAANLIDRASIGKTAVAGLVSAGTITQAQADAINTAFAAAPARGPMDRDRRGHGRHGERGQFSLNATASVSAKA